MNISKSDYIKALQAEGVLKERRKEVLKAFAEFDGYRACNKDLATVTGDHPNFINLVFGHLAKAVSEYFGINDREELDSTDWWPIIADGKREKNGFYWTLNKNFVEAALELGVFSEPNFFPDEAEAEALIMFEGGLRKILVNAYERNKKAREKCIEHYGAVCRVCNIDFEKIYGIRGRGFIHVHHIIKVSDQGGTKYKVDPVNDLQPLCPNCHAMIHCGGEQLNIEQLKNIIQHKY